MCGA